MYNPDEGGFLASVSITVTTIISHEPVSISPSYDYFKIDASTQTNSSSFSQCGGSIAIRDYTKFNTSNVTLTTNSSYLVSPNTVIVGKHSDQWHVGPRPYSASIESEGYFRANPSKCMQFNDAVQDSWTFNN